VEAAVEAEGVDDLADLALVEVLAQVLDRQLRRVGAQQRERSQERQLVVGEARALGIADARREIVRQSLTKPRLVS
jgi:hypothetical protein